MKTRNIIKYAVAATIAGLTVAAITVMQVVKHDRRSRGEEERRRIEQVFRQNNIPGSLPATMEGTPVAPVATPQVPPGATPAPPTAQPAR